METLEDVDIDDDVDRELDVDKLIKKQLKTNFKEKIDYCDKIRRL